MDSKSKFQQTLNSLNESQRESVLSNVNTLQILAGPGSGKTRLVTTFLFFVRHNRIFLLLSIKRVLTCRVAYFVIERVISPKHIIVVTFTNKAAAEMKHRLKGLIGEEETKSLLLGTFHAICCRMLRLHARHVDLDPSFTVADTEASKEIIAKLRKDPGLKISAFTRSKMTVGMYHTCEKCRNFV